jgi:hypothetical protein
MYLYTLTTVVYFSSDKFTLVYIYVELMASKLNTFLENVLVNCSLLLLKINSDDPEESTN